MKALIACILIYHFDMQWGWYAAVAIVAAWDERAAWNRWRDSQRALHSTQDTLSAILRRAERND